MQLRGTFTADGSSLGGGRMRGEVDLRSAGAAPEHWLGLTDPDDACALLIGFGSVCDPCSTDGRSYCLVIEIDQISGEQVEAELSCVDEVSCHPLCSTSTCDDPGTGECL
jgi:hypothetical protein